MNISWDELLRRLRADRDYQSAFSATYASGRNGHPFSMR
jgi:hypothetical protein